MELLDSAVSDGCSHANPELSDVADEAVCQQLHAVSVCSIKSTLYYLSHVLDSIVFVHKVKL